MTLFVELLDVSSSCCVLVLKSRNSMRHDVDYEQKTNRCIKYKQPVSTTNSNSSLLKKKNEHPLTKKHCLDLSKVIQFYDFLFRQKKKETDTVLFPGFNELDFDIGVKLVEVGKVVVVDWKFRVRHNENNQVVKSFSR